MVFKLINKYSYMIYDPNNKEYERMRKQIELKIHEFRGENHNERLNKICDKMLKKYYTQKEFRCFAHTLQGDRCKKDIVKSSKHYCNIHKMRYNNILDILSKNLSNYVSDYCIRLFL